MITKKLKDIYKYSAGLRKYNNAVEATRWAQFLRRFSGTSVYEILSLPGNRIVSKFTIVGFIFYLFWASLYFYCTYISHFADQTILRMLYNTKLKRYGDDFERTSSLLYVLVCLVLIPLKLGNSGLAQKIVEVDSVMENAGYIVDYHRIARTALSTTVTQVCIYIIRMTCIYLSLSSSVVMPVEKFFQVVYSDTLALITTALYCYYLLILRNRFKWINKTLREIENRNSWEHKVFVRSKMPANMIKVVELQDRHVCEKIKTCARAYSMLFHSCQMLNKMFGLSLLFTLLHYFNYIILYLFYFMEATASGLFYDFKRYFNFLMYTFWEIAIAVGIIFMIITFCEIAVAHAKKTSFVIHKIINEDFSTKINHEAMQLSIQLLHEAPVFSVCGLFNLDYAFLQQGARSVLTYLVILLQFVTENTAPKI